MRYQISGKHLDIGSSLSEHVEKEMTDILNKYAIRPVEVFVTFSKNRHEFTCEATVHLSTGLTAIAHGRSTDIYGCFDVAAEKLDKQLRRYKRRLKDHHRNRTSPVESAGAQQYILAAEGDGGESPEPELLKPVIIAELETDIKSVSVGEAVMQMELAGEPVLVFRNDSHKGINVVYRRNDGNIGWIDPERLD